MNKTDSADGTAVIPVAPSGLPFLGHALRMRSDPLSFFESLRDHGDIVQIKLGPRRVYVLNSVEAIRGVLVSGQSHFYKGDHISVARALIRDGLISAEGETHRRQRRLMQPAFRRERIAQYADIMQEQILERTATWRPGDTVDVRIEMATLTIAVAAKSLISAEPGKDLVDFIVHTMPRVFDLMYQRMVTPLSLLNKLPLPRNREWAASVARLHSMVDEVIADYRGGCISRNDLLSMLLAAEDDESGDVLSDGEVHDQVTAILVAGSETTAATLTWIFYTLSRHPHIEARLFAEVDEVLNGRAAEYADLRQLPYTAQVVTEALRYYSPAWILTRSAIEDVDLVDYRIPAGSSVMFSPYVVHRDPRLFQDPDTFDPDRWSPERAADIPRGAVLQFGTGPRKCIGEVFAVVEATLALATIAARWRLRAQPGATIDAVARTTHTPRSLLMTLEKRTD
ncbi:cytochrome P450 [Nocardia beijingensis]|uniref:cytochrome P450 n=1 Tax=Nocardia beijingensis TaxID=95162 RepID=UPI00332F0AA1